MNLSDTFYVALCMTVLILGAVYWFWTQNQFMLRKLNLLENIVYEMKSILPGGGAPPADLGAPTGLSTTTYAPAPGSVMSDDDAEILNDDLHGALGSEYNAPVEQNSPVLEVTDLDVPTFAMPEPGATGSAGSAGSAVAVAASATAAVVSDDLQPGGVGSGVDDDKTGSSAYDNMTLKDLRKLADSRGITGAKTMAKQALINALRNTPVGTTFDVTEGVLDLN